jgi:type II secretory pathway pseudopilin PulG
MNRAPPSKCVASRAGATLLELVVSTAVAALLLTGMVSAITITSRAIPPANGVQAANRNAARAVDQLAAELGCAMTLIKAKSTEIEFTVADRDGNTPNPEKIRYSWAGSGKPLVRQYNDGAAVNVVDSAINFALTYETKSTGWGSSRKTYTKAVLCTLHSGNDANGLIIHRIRMLNQPLKPK